MIYLLYGGDDLGVQECLTSMKENITPAETRDVNISVLDGTEVGLGELTAVCDTVPFLAERRMVVVRGLLSRFERRFTSRAAPSREPPLEEWAALRDYLPRVPETTDLVFVDGLLRGSNSLLALVRPLAQVRAFPLPRAGELRQWVRQRAASRAIDIEPQAVDALVETIGPNTRVIDMELQKLSLYRWAQTIRRQDAIELVSYARDVNIFAAIDAVLEGRTGDGIRHVDQLLESGHSPPYLITMMARQVRQLLLAKELKAQGLAPAEVGNRMSLSGFPLRKTLEQERAFTAEHLVQFHHRLLEADLRLKTGASDDRLELEMLIAEQAARPGGV